MCHEEKVQKFDTHPHQSAFRLTASPFKGEALTGDRKGRPYGFSRTCVQTRGHGQPDVSPARSEHKNAAHWAAFGTFIRTRVHPQTPEKIPRTLLTQYRSQTVSRFQFFEWRSYPRPIHVAVIGSLMPVETAWGYAHGAGRQFACRRDCRLHFSRDF